PVVPLEDPPTNPHPPLPRRGEFRPFKHGPGNPLQDIALARSVPTAERRALVAEHYIKDLGRPVFPHVRSEPGKRKVSSNRYVEELQKTG
ncbi:MAG TPA: hypothetical protein VNA13_03855, partial [Xanthomonadales bacterium]|nr:hypothetical protein [Xanthomonadales bacterium]